jgi:hypothetical protein
MKLHASFEYAGLPDYWGGNGRRWDDDAGMLFAYYGGFTTLHDIVEQWIDDFGFNGEFDSPVWDDVSDEEIRAAVMAGLTEQGLADYHSHALSEWSADYADANDMTEDSEDDDFGDSPIAVLLLEIVDESD